MRTVEADFKVLCYDSVTKKKEKHQIQIVNGRMKTQCDCYRCGEVKRSFLINVLPHREQSKRFEYREIASAIPIGRLPLQVRKYLKVVHDIREDRRRKDWIEMNRLDSMDGYRVTAERRKMNLVKKLYQAELDSFCLNYFSLHFFSIHCTFGKIPDHFWDALNGIRERAEASGWGINRIQLWGPALFDKNTEEFFIYAAVPRKGLLRISKETTVIVS